MITSPEALLTPKAKVKASTLSVAEVPPAKDSRSAVGTLSFSLKLMVLPSANETSKSVTPETAPELILTLLMVLLVAAEILPVELIDQLAEVSARLVEAWLLPMLIVSAEVASVPMLMVSAAVPVPRLIVLATAEVNKLAVVEELPATGKSSDKAVVVSVVSITR